MAVYNIVDYGALAGGVENCAAAIQAAIDACAQAGGGRVLVPAGAFLSGSIRLRSDVDLHLEAGATLISSLNPADIARLDGSPAGPADGCFLGALHARNVTISGMGTIYGQGDRVFSGEDTGDPFDECPKRCAAFRPRLTLFEDVENLTVRDATFRDAALWTLHMAGCRRVRVTNIRILGDPRGANNDGIDPDCCQDVVISGCIVRTGDDAIVVKSTREMAALYGPCERIVITGCVLHSHDSALKIGTETHADIRNIVFSDCVVDDCSRAVGIWVRDGATIEDIHIHHLTGAVRRYADGGELRWWGKGEPIFISAAPRRQTPDAYPGRVRGVTVDHVYLDAESCVFLGGEAGSPIEDVSLSDIRLRQRAQGTQPSGLFDEQPSARDVYLHPVPVLYGRHVKGLRVRGMTFSRQTPPMAGWAQEPVILTHCEGTRLDIEEIDP